MHNEAPSSVSYNITSPNGFDLIFTVRDEKFEALLETMVQIEDHFMEKGYTAQEKRSYGGKKKQEDEVVQGRACPKCGKPLVYFTTKDGKKHIKCSTQKYDFQTKTRTGCDFVEWADDNTEATPTGDAPTAGQKKVLEAKGLWVDGMTQAEANDLISGLRG